VGATDSQAFRDLQTGLVSVDDVLSYAKTGVGKPKREERSLFVASVALSYAMWENYVEDVAIEATELLQRNIDPSAVPSEVRDWIMKSSPTSTAWDIAVYPGWRSLWLAMVTQQAKGDTVETDLGMNTANARNVRRLFERVGVRGWVLIRSPAQPRPVSRTSTDSSRSAGRLFTPERRPKASTRKTQRPGAPSSKTSPRSLTRRPPKASMPS
jgi:hypothetical protein